MVLNLVALVVSIASLVTSLLVALRQMSMMRHANELPIFVELTQEFSSLEFQKAQIIVQSDLMKNVGPGVAVSQLPEDVCLPATQVIAFFITLGALVTWGLVDKALVVYMFGYQAARAWALCKCRS